MLKTLWIIWLLAVWFFALVAHKMAFNLHGLNGIAILLGAFWFAYLAGLWIEQSRITDTAWAMLLGYAIGCIRMLDLIPNRQQYVHWLRLVPKSLIAPIVIAFICIFVGILPLMASNIIKSHKQKNRVLGRD